MLITLVGAQAATLCTELDTAGVRYVSRPPIPGTISNAGVIIEVVNPTSDVIMAVATAFADWMRLRRARNVVITTKDGEVFYAAGMSREDKAKLLKIAIGTMVFDTAKAPAVESLGEEP